MWKEILGGVSTGNLSADISKPASIELGEMS